MIRQLTEFALPLDPQANLINRLFIVPQLTLSDYQGTESLIRC